MTKPKEKILIELNEKDLLAIIADVYGLDQITATISVSHYSGDQRDAEYTKVIVKGEKLDPK